MAYGFVCVRCGRLELAHNGIITEADGEVPDRIKLTRYKISLKNCKKYTASVEEILVAMRDKKKVKRTVYKPRLS